MMDNDDYWGEEYNPPYPHARLPEQHLWEAHVRLRIEDYNGSSADAQGLCEKCHDDMHGGLKCMVVAGVKDVRKNCIFAHTNQRCAHDYFEFEFEGTCEMLGIEYTYARKELGWTYEEGWPEKLKAFGNTGLSGSAGDADGASDVVGQLHSGQETE